MERMEGEEGRHEGALDHRSRQAAQSGEEKQRRRQVQQDIGEMIAARIEPPELMVDHQGDPGQGMPEAGVGGRQCPPRRCRRQSGQHLGFFDHIDMVVEKDEIEGGQAPEHRQDGQGQPQEDQALRDGGTGELMLRKNANFQDLTPLYVWLCPVPEAIAGKSSD